MKILPTFFLLAFIASSLSAQTTPDVATQRMLKQYGVESEVLRAFSELEAETKRPDGRFEFLLSGPPELFVLLDRDYWVLSTWNPKKERKGSSYILNPKDEQSALNITVDDGENEREGLDRKNDPGFSGYSSRKGVLAGSQVLWRRCSDANHLYSEATVFVTIGSGSKSSTFTVRVDITANSEARRRALEDSVEDLELRNPTTERGQ